MAARPRPSRLGRHAARSAGAPGGSIPALLALYACWGSAVPAIKLMVDTIPPLAGAGAVFTLGGLLLLAAARPARATVTRRQLARAAVVGILLFVGGQGLGTIALTQLTASLTAVLIATIPLVIALLARLSGLPAARGTALRLLAGFGGVAVVVLTAPAAALGGSPAGIAITLAAVVCWASGTFLGSRGGLPDDARTSGGAQLLAGGAVLLGLAVVAGQLSPAAFTGVSGTSVGAAVFLLVTDSVGGFLLYTHLLRTTPVELVATYAYATPVIAALLGFVVLGEPFWAGALVGGALVVAAVGSQVRAGLRRD